MEDVFCILPSWNRLTQEIAAIVSPCTSFRQNLSIMTGAGGARL
jgi:hypothetical protein